MATHAVVAFINQCDTFDTTCPFPSPISINCHVIPKVNYKNDENDEHYHMHDHSHSCAQHEHWRIHNIYNYILYYTAAMHGAGTGVAIYCSCMYK